MAKAGDVIGHPVTGERIEFLKTARETDGRSLRMGLLVEPRGFAAVEHVHPNQDERFEILSGRFRYRVDGVEREAGAGEVVEVPKGVTHVWRNAGEEDLRMIIEFRPALRSEEFFESFFALGQDGKTDPETGMPNPVRTATVLHEFRDEIRPVKPPQFVQPVLFGMLAFVGRLIGYRARHPYPYAAERGHAVLAAG